MDYLPISLQTQKNIFERPAMAANVLVDASFLVAFLSRRDTYYGWALAQSRRLSLPWKTCEAALSEAFYFLGIGGAPRLAALLRQRAVVCAFDLAAETDEVLQLMTKYADLPMSLADACLVRMTERLPDSIVLTLDRDFRIYRRHGRKVIPCIMPS
jgi:predicted nucleic acid-binding protein